MKDFILGDCMEGMKEFPDNYFDLAIVDPPYGIGIDGQKGDIRKGVQIRKTHKFKGWDNARPSEDYFNELKRVSKNQIIWGGNYFVEFLKPSKGWVFWYKGQEGLTMSDGELAFTSFDKPTRWVNIHRTHLWQEKPIHPTQKPVKLYKWLLRNYATSDMKIIDTHVGSGSSIIAFEDFGCEYIGFELDKDYYEAASKRIKQHKSQLVLL